MVLKTIEFNMAINQEELRGSFSALESSVKSYNVSMCVAKEKFSSMEAEYQRLSVE